MTELIINGFDICSNEELLSANGGANVGLIVSGTIMIASGAITAVECPPLGIVTMIGGGITIVAGIVY